MTRNGIATLVLLADFLFGLMGTAQAETIYEDDPRWDCRTMGNFVCGPANSQGVPMGHYLSLILVLAPE